MGNKITYLQRCSRCQARRIAWYCDRPGQTWPAEMGQAHVESFILEPEKSTLCRTYRISDLEYAKEMWTLTRARMRYRLKACEECYQSHFRDIALVENHQWKRVTSYFFLP